MSGHRRKLMSRRWPSAKIASADDCFASFSSATCLGGIANWTLLFLTGCPPMTPHAIQLLAILITLSARPSAPFRIDPGLGATIESRIAPLLKAGDFAGVIFVAQGGKVVFHKAYGLANRELGVRNTPEPPLRGARRSMVRLHGLR
jgi:hypothetical protein